MAKYRIIGAADCPYFARSERLGHILAATYPGFEVLVEMKHPDAWESYYLQTCKVLGYTPRSGPIPIPSSQQRPPVTLASAGGGGNPKDIAPSSNEGRVLVWDPVTLRVVGGESAWKLEVYTKYMIQCDISWGSCLAIAKENAAFYVQQQQHRLTRPLGIVLAGRPMSGKRTIIPMLVEKYGLVHINCGALVVEASRKATESGRYIASFFKERLEALRQHEASETALIRSAGDDGMISSSRNSGYRLGFRDRSGSVSSSDGSGGDTGVGRGEASQLGSPTTTAKRMDRDHSHEHVPVNYGWADEVKVPDVDPLEAVSLPSMLAGAATVPLLPDAVITPLVLEALQQPEVKQRGFVLEGFPRTTAQAAALRAADVDVELVVMLDIDDAVAAQRSKLRVIDPVTDRAYQSSSSRTSSSFSHTGSSSSTNLDHAVKEALARRVDDSVEALAVRLRHFELSVRPTLQHTYPDRLARIDAGRPPWEVFEDVKAKVDALRLEKPVA